MAALVTLAVFGCDQKPTATPPATDEPAAETASPPKAETPRASESGAATAAPETTDPSKGTATASRTDKVVVSPATKATTDTPAEPQKGSEASAASFSTWLQSSGSYEKGKQSSVTAVLVAKPPYKCNDKYPYKFKLDAPAGGISYPQSTVQGMQISPKRSTMAIPFVASQAGKANISGTLSFSVCTDERCLIEKRALSIAVDVE